MLSKKKRELNENSVLCNGQKLRPVNEMELISRQGNFTIKQKQNQMQKDNETKQCLWNKF